MMRLDSSALIEFLTEVNKELNRSVTLVAVGGTALTLLHVKPSTVDVDFTVPSEDYDEFQEALRSTPHGFTVHCWKDGNVFSQMLPDDYLKRSKDIKECSNPLHDQDQDISVCLRLSFLDVASGEDENVMSIARDAFVAFLLDAKRHTYAAQGDEASVTPLLPESRQLEYRREPLLYRDVYFGNDFFVGQETVYHNTIPFWAMSYAGGVAGDVEKSEVYSFLRKALQAVTQTRPYRGPKRFSDRSWEYTNGSHGDVERFWGVETIAYRKKRVYGLRYAGGLLR